jgi:uncharacterized membrane-anchored protein YjiN (DUF445 family)
MINKIKLFVEENQASLIKIGGSVVGALVGVIVAALIMGSSDEVIFETEEE